MLSGAYIKHNIHVVPPSYDIHSAGLTKQIKLVFKSDLPLFAKSNFFQISQTGKPQIPIKQCVVHPVGMPNYIDGG